MKNSKLLSLSLLISLMTTPAAAQLPGVKVVSRFEMLDAHALKAPKEAEASLKDLAAYLVKPAKNDLEKARAIFAWVAQKIYYDVERMRFDNTEPNFSAEEVLQKRAAFCGGYSKLVKALCDHAGVEAVVIRGYGKSSIDPPGADYKKNLHAWNAVKIDGKWLLLDPTWAAGTFIQGKYVQKYDDDHFAMPPDQFIFTHFPREEKWQFLERPLTYEQFTKLPYAPSELFAIGFNAEQIFKKIKETGLREVVKTYVLPKQVRIRVREAPVEKHLQVGKSYRFVLEAKGVSTIAVKINNRLIPAAQTEPGVYSGTVTIPADGPFQIYMLQPSDTNPSAQTYTPILTYEGVASLPVKK